MESSLQPFWQLSLPGGTAAEPPPWHPPPQGATQPAAEMGSPGPPHVPAGAHG